MRTFVLSLLFALGTIELARADTIRMAVTTSFENSGLADVLLPEISGDLGFEIQLLVVGSGQALELGAAGDVDDTFAGLQRSYVQEFPGDRLGDGGYEEFLVEGGGGAGVVAVRNG